MDGCSISSVKLKVFERIVLCSEQGEVKWLAKVLCTWLGNGGEARLGLVFSLVCIGFSVVG